MPEEGDPHESTWMVFGASEEIWGELASGVQEDVAAVACAIAEFEPVNLLVRAADRQLAEELHKGCTNVTFIEADMDDIWARDTGPVFVRRGSSLLAGVGFNFNGWGNKQEHAKDNAVAKKMAGCAGVPFVQSQYVLEGGGLEVDGEGTLIATESCILNDNRNPGVTKAQMEAEFKKLLGITKVIWMPGVKGRDITDAHVDFYARFAKPGVVVAHVDTDPLSPDYNVTIENLRILRSATDAHGRALEVHTLTAPAFDKLRWTGKKDSFASSYINYYIANGAVIAPSFGDSTTDEATKTLLQTQYPGRKVVQLNIDRIAAGGGGIHCITQQQPYAAGHKGPSSSGASSNGGCNPGAYSFVMILTLAFGLALV